MSQSDNDMTFNLVLKFEDWVDSAGVVVPITSCVAKKPVHTVFISNCTRPLKHPRPNSKIYNISLLARSVLNKNIVIYTP